MRKTPSIPASVEEEQSPPSVDVAVPEVASETITEEPLRWFTGKWNGLDNYECAFSDGYATLSLDDIGDHWKRVHGPPPEPEPVRVVQLFDRYGNPL